jgi:ABC-2 type transport system ATP-binding protein
MIAARQKPDRDVVSTPFTVEIRGVSKTYPGAPQPAVDNIDLAIARGRLFGLLGPNGAGKTTLLSMLCGLLNPSAGTIRVEGFDVQHAADAVRSRIGLVPQDLAIYPALTARENLAYFGGIQGLRGAALKTRIDYCLSTAGLEALADRRVETFSGGLKRRLNLVIALIHQPELLILDEPTVGIDPQSRRFIHENLRRLNREGLSIIYTSHYMEEVEQLCDELAIIDHGHIIARGTLNEILNRLTSGAIHLRVNVPVTEAVQTQLREIEGVRTLAYHGALLHLDSATPQPTLAQVLALLRREGVDVVSVSMGAVNLEQVFIALTGTSLRDEVA